MAYRWASSALLTATVVAALLGACCTFRTALDSSTRCYLGNFRIGWCVDGRLCPTGPFIFDSGCPGQVCCAKPNLRRTPLGAAAWDSDQLSVTRTLYRDCGELYFSCHPSIPRFFTYPSTPLCDLVSPLIGGISAIPGTWPWMVALGEKGRDGIKWFCGGTLISSRTVLTAAHCTRGRRADRLVLSLGENSRDSKDAVKAYVHRILEHPQYNAKASHHDLALLLLCPPVPLSDWVRPACLPPPRADYTNATVHLAGWGQLEWDGNFPNSLQDVELVVGQTQACENAYRISHWFGLDFPGGFQDTKLCATGVSGTNRGACMGDSGGPLIARDNWRFTVVGVVLGARGCGNPQFPGIYTKVSEYVDWIVENSDYE